MRRTLLSTLTGLLMLSAMTRCALAQGGRVESSDRATQLERELGSSAGHHDAGHGAHLGTAGVSTKPEEFKSDLAIYTFVVFLLLLAILWKFAWGPIVVGLEKREHGIAEQIAAADRAHQDAKLMLASYQQQLDSAAEQTRAMLDEARRDAEQTKVEIVAEAKAAAQAEHDRALREIRTATDRSLKELSERSADLAVGLAGKILKNQLSKQDHARLVDEAMTSFGAIPSVN